MGVSSGLFLESELEMESKKEEADAREQGVQGLRSPRGAGAEVGAGEVGLPPPAGWVSVCAISTAPSALLAPRSASFACQTLTSVLSVLRMCCC